MHSIAIFVACLALTMGCECVVFSPARRASRKLLERMVPAGVDCGRRRCVSRALSLQGLPPAQIEFVRLLGHEPLEFNQEQARVMAYDGRASIIRSFPSKVGVSGIARSNPGANHKHARTPPRGRSNPTHHLSPTHRVWNR